MRLLILMCIGALAGLGLEQPLYLFDNGAGRGQQAIEDQVELAHAQGYAGIFYTGTREIPRLIEAHRSRGMQVLGLYTGIQLNDAVPAVDPGLETAIRQLKGTRAVITFTINGKRANTEEGDAVALPILRQVADWAKDSGLEVALYPHHGFHVARIEDALRLIGKAAKPNVGMVFNLCHWLRSGDIDNLDLRLEEALPHVKLVSINGADRTGGWDQLIQPLDAGNYDVRAFTRKFMERGYRGPFALQCYNLKGDAAENARRSMRAWRKF